MAAPVLHIHSVEGVASPPSPPRTTLLREPLLHFVLLGGLIFAADHFLFARTAAPHTIVMGAGVEREAIDTFRAARGREPDAKELDTLRGAWVDDEVLYREGLALKLDKGDSVIRERVIFKALSVVDSNLKVPPVTDQMLRQWFESHRDKYDEAARYDFHEAALSGDNSEGAVRGFVQALNSGTPGDAKAVLRVFKTRPHESIVLSYGAEVAKALEGAKVGEWHALRTEEGWRGMLLDAVVEPKPASFEALREVVLHDWEAAETAEKRSAAVHALARKYTVKHEVASKEGAE